MTIGVPDTEVFAAADRVLARGERPTVERVRGELGRGSPARVGQLLETWWEALAKRLGNHARLPDVPPAVAEAFSAAWAAAVTAGQAHGEAQVAPERAALVEVMTRADAARAEHRVAREEAIRVAEHATVRADGLAAQLTDLQARLADKEEQRSVGEADRRHLLVRLERVETSLADAERGRAEERAAAAREREVLQAHVRQVEDRAAQMVDRAREDLKAVRKELAIVQKERSLATKELQVAQQAHVVAERRAAVAEARARPAPPVKRKQTTAKTVASGRS